MFMRFLSPCIVSITLVSSAFLAHGSGGSIQHDRIVGAPAIEQVDGLMSAPQDLPPRLDLTRIAVRTGLDEAEPGTLLGEVFGTGPVAFEQIAVGGWFFINVPVSEQKETRIEEVLATLAERDGIMMAAPVLLSSEGSPGMPTSTILVRFQEDLLPHQADRVLAGRGLEPVAEVTWPSFPGMYAVTCSSRNGLEVMAAARELSDHPAVRHAEVDMLFRGQSGGFDYPNDPDFEFCWGLHNDGTHGTEDADMDVLEAWAITTGDPSVEVLVIDTGVQQDHPELNQNPGIDFTTDDGDGGPRNGCDRHGTVVAGCISSIVNNESLMAGAAPGCKTVSARCFVSDWIFCSNGWWSQYSHTVGALDYAVVSDIEVTNNSNSYGGWRSHTIDEAYAQSREAGVVHFASAGNTADWYFAYPASLPSVMSISALNQYGDFTSFSSYCPGVALCAPGQWILTTDRTGEDGYTDEDYAYVEGTSFSSPYAAAVAALVLSVRPDLTPLEVENILKDSAVDYGDPGLDLLYGWGVVNANNALNQLVSGVTHEVCPSGCTYDSLQDAIDAASNGDTILVGPGVYTGDPLAPAVMQTYGKQVVIRSTDGPYETIIDGQGVQRGLLCDSGESIDNVIDGFTFRNGQAVDYDWGDGVLWNLGGALCCLNASSPRILNCIIENNHAQFGGGIYGYTTHMRLDNCLIQNNTADDYGGGVNTSHESRLLATNCHFAGNTAGLGGGALSFSEDDEPLISSCLFTENSTPLAGGVAFVEESSLPTFINCRFEDNDSDDSGGVFHVTFARVEVFDCAFERNTAQAGGVLWVEASNVEFDNISAIDNVATFGDGGVFCFASNSGGLLRNSELIDNSAREHGGAASLISSNLNIQDSTISSNNAGTDGGGLYVLNGGLTLMNTTVCGNSPEQIAGTGWGDQGGNLILEQCQACGGDLTDDDTVNGADLSLLLGAWGNASGPADIDGSGLVDGADLAALLSFWGDC